MTGPNPTLALAVRIEAAIATGRHRWSNDPAVQADRAAIREIYDRARRANSTAADWDLARVARTEWIFAVLREAITVEKESGTTP